MSQEFKRKLQEARATLGLSQSKFANRLGVPLFTLQAWETSRNTPDAFKLKMLEEKITQLLAEK